MIRRIRDLLYDEGFTISGARNKLREAPTLLQTQEGGVAGYADEMEEDHFACAWGGEMHALRKELLEIRALLDGQG